ncbi:DUF2752 domain-containing protein [Streptomonospora sp. PA3]|uniref:DUF2752 domain-containing protein n=1 Tax=Streptomonospora sp. PA3 TaxID=2607326 RepID=UPI0012DFAC55|nr:DUF2752 domain-containing protein [Streptomonospora sp. PA3]MUL43679.1 DUF2752 domain-containing protein [Streptomonospora sp. PA3]
MPEWLRPVEFRVEERDGLRPMAWPALGGLTLGAAMAVFGLPPVDVHGITHYFGIMDPLCGATRSVWAAMSGDVALSWKYNPLGTVLVIGAVGTLARFVFGALTGRWINLRVRSWTTVAVVAGALIGLLAIRQQMNAELLRTPAGEFSPIGPVLNALPILALAAWVAIGRHRIRRRARRRSPG